MPSLEQSCMIVIVFVLSVHSVCSEISELSELSELLKTDNGGQGPTLYSQMCLAITHDYDVGLDGIVTIDGRRYEIWPEVHEIG